MFSEQEKIDKYLNNEMTTAELQAFRKEIKHDPKLAETVALNKDIIDFFKERSLNRSSEKSPAFGEFYDEHTAVAQPHKKSFKIKSLLFPFGVGVIILINLFSSKSIISAKTQLNSPDFDAEKDVISTEVVQNESQTLPTSY